MARSRPRVGFSDPFHDEIEMYASALEFVGFDVIALTEPDPSARTPSRDDCGITCGNDGVGNRSRLPWARPRVSGRTGRLTHIPPSLRAPGPQQFVLSRQQFRQRVELLDARRIVFGDDELEARPVRIETRFAGDRLAAPTKEIHHGQPRPFAGSRRTVCHESVCKSVHMT